MNEFEDAWNKFYREANALPASPAKAAMLGFVTRAASEYDKLPAPALHYSDAEPASMPTVLLWRKSHLEFVQVEFLPSGRYNVMLNQATVEPSISIFEGFA